MRILWENGRKKRLFRNKKRLHRKFALNPTALRRVEKKKRLSGNNENAII